MWTTKMLAFLSSIVSTNLRLLISSTFLGVGKALVTMYDLQMNLLATNSQS